jgi:hypothetical protein
MRQALFYGRQWAMGCARAEPGCWREAQPEAIARSGKFPAVDSPQSAEALRQRQFYRLSIKLHCLLFTLAKFFQRI